MSLPGRRPHVRPPWWIDVLLWVSVFLAITVDFAG